MEGLTRRRFVSAAGAAIAGVALSGSVAAQDLNRASKAHFERWSPPPNASTPQTWNVKLGGQYAGGEIVLLGFFPQLIWINAGDSITWTGNSAEPHTVTFLAPGQQRPPFNQNDPAQTKIVPPTPSDGINKYDGVSYTNSGLIPQGQTYTLRFDQEGDFTSYCLMHDMMRSVIHVRPQGTPYPYGQAYYDRVAQEQLTAQQKYGEQVRLVSWIESSSFERRGYHVSIGGGNGPVALMRFYPETLMVRVGSSVTFTNLDVEAPHTVTFGPEPSPDRLPLPAGDPRNYGDPSETLSSGFIGLDPNFFGNSFTVTFTAAGKYPYRCLLHDEMGMVGTIIVVDR